jgi:hypothetical protein
MSIKQPLEVDYADWQKILAKRTISYQEKDYASGYIEVFPADLPYGLRSHSTVKAMEFIHCYLDPAFVATIAHESVNPDRVGTRNEPILLLPPI